MKYLSLFLALLLVPVNVDAYTAPAPVKIIDSGSTVIYQGARVARLYGSINAHNYRSFERDMIETAGKPGPRIVLINSGGGSVNWGKSYINLIDKEKGQGIKIVCFVIKEASSMAFNFLTNCDVRIGSTDTQCLAHKMEFQSVDKQDGRNTATKLRRLAAELDQDDEPYRAANSAAMSLSLTEYDNYADNETYWYAQDLLARGYFSAICTLKK